MKKISLSLILSIFAFGFIQAQEIPKTTNSGASVKPATSGSNSVFLPRVNNEVEDIFMKKEERKINMRQDKNGLLTEGDRVAAEWKADKKAKEEYANDQYLGDVKTTGKFVELYCRDHEFVDGDRVKITVNGEVIYKNLALTGSYKPILVTLQSGFNTIEFEALNQGLSGPNTAMLKVFGEDGQQLVSKEWNLLTGAKASLMVVKQ
ncbi:hypothetical protein [Zunongwangia atlantica]|uniref:Secreted protein n=1 Tax=Zunongwangia atlantica 22II14-10F7 TaxID=1185767 RepID=A0A1Y1T717_9FLAO|nr:hypothetical protein [Zunongwangia atlantica]ORL46355.1 hypothetical protein IIF7_04897 [Zunongwangia atlantica 22II14-10F7]